MAKLVLSCNGAIVHQRFLEQGRVAIGRERDNELPIDDPAVAPRHAAIACIGNDHILEDLQSEAGTFVNGTRISRHILQHGDVAQFGAFYLRYLNPKASSEADLERTMMIRGVEGVVHGEPATERAASRTPSRRANVRLPRGHVRITAGTRAGEAIELDRVIATFGTPGDQVAVITRRPHGFFVTHVEGRRHARVNGRAIGLEARALKDRDVIEVGDATLEVVLGSRHDPYRPSDR
jgi:pSer/pThr/pTyr-binding forkhead associated (FHA) protein